jgi:hypothetical protein
MQAQPAFLGMRMPPVYRYRGEQTRMNNERDAGAQVPKGSPTNAMQERDDLREPRQEPEQSANTRKEAGADVRIKNKDKSFGYRKSEYIKGW